MTETTCYAMLKGERHAAIAIADYPIAQYRNRP
jgi:hypothetical protein